MKITIKTRIMNTITGISVFIIVFSIISIITNITSTNNDEIMLNETPVQHRTMIEALKNDLDLTPNEFFQQEANHTTEDNIIVPGLDSATRINNDNTMALCTLGFTANVNNKPAIIFADHCNNNTTQVTNEAVQVSKTTGKAYPMNFGKTIWSGKNNNIDIQVSTTKYDNYYEAVKKSNAGSYEITKHPVSKIFNHNHFAIDTIKPGNDSNNSIILNNVATPVMHENVCSYGRTSGWRCGKINDITTNTFGTDYCSRSGDSGGFVISGRGLLGITSTAMHHKTSNRFTNDINNYVFCKDGYRNRQNYINNSNNARLDTAINIMRSNSMIVEF